MSFAADVPVPPRSLIASDLFMVSNLPMEEFNHGLTANSTEVETAELEALTLPSMLEQTPVGQRLRTACEVAGFGVGGDTPASRAALGKALGVSAAAISKLFSGQSATLNAANLFAAADLLNVDPRWLATGQGEMRPAHLPTDVLDLAQVLHKIQEPALRRATLAVVRVIANDPLGQMANSMTKLADAQRWSPNVQRIADGLETMEDGGLKRVAIAWAMTAAFNPERLPREEDEPEVPARRASDKRLAKSRKPG